ncbi:hypothetical protein ACPWSR_15320 [Alloiococcus sp. CFN-8]|uniref:hypothetical protein n=1 Tax=Alloiococcus sp. CFN-8 TaxID=3416081 RepID=UPI003CF1A452
MNKNKKMYSALAMTAAVALMTGAFAWLTQEADVTNRFATPYEGRFDAQIVETVFDEEENDDVTQYYNDTENVWELVVPDQFKPGDSIKKEVRFENTGTYDQLVRIQFNPDLAEGLSLVGTGALDEQWTYIVEGEGDEGVGYYYYNFILEDGEDTDMILEAIKFEEDFVGPNVNLDASIFIKLETVQLSDDNVAAQEVFGRAPLDINGLNVSWIAR